MTDRLIKREKEKEKGTEQWWQKIIAVRVRRQVKREMELCHGGGRSWEREKHRDWLMKTWKRQEMDLYSQLILRSVWLLEGEQMCLLAHGSHYSRAMIHRLTDEYGTSPVRHISRFISHRETDIQSIRHFSAALKDGGEGWVGDEGWWQRKEGLRDRMRNVMKVTKWQKEDNKTRCLCRVCFLMLRSPRCRGMLEIIWSAAWKRVSVIHESCTVNSGPVFKRYKRGYLGCLSTPSCH